MRGGNFIVIQEAALASGAATLLDLLAEPIIVIHRARQKVEGDLIDRACSFGR